VTLLTNKIILITKSRAESEVAIRPLINEGAKIVYFPTIRINPIFESEMLKDTIKIIDEIDYVIFTSINAAEVFAKISNDRFLDLTHTRIAAVGESTAEKCRSLGFYIHIVPNEYSASGLLKSFQNINIAGKKILIPCSSLSRDELVVGLTELGAEVFAVPIYDVGENSIEELHTEYESIQTQKPDLFIFTSPSSFANFIKIVSIDNIKEYFSKCTIAVIGTTTESAVRSYGLTVNIVPKVFSLQGLSEAIIKFYNISHNVV